MPISKTLTVEVQERDDSLICLRTIVDLKTIKEFQLDYSALGNKEPAEAGQIIRSMPGGDWGAYVIGCLSVLQFAKKISVRGMNALINSSIPPGKGVASSAALEVAAMNAISRMYNLHLTEIELPILAQQVENTVVGAACGLMDQLTVHLGQKNKLLPIICQPSTVFKPISIPRGVQFYGIDSDVRHAVGGASYSEVRTATFMAYTVVASLEQISANELFESKHKNNFSSLPYGGYLANIPVSVFEGKYAAHLPENISGEEFLDKYKVSIDTVTQVNRGINYKLLSCARHPVYENFRVNLFYQLLQQFSKAADKIKILQMLGELMLQSHASYSSVGLGNAATDEIVEMVRQCGCDSGVYGARVTGGGSGGTIAVLCFGKEGRQSVKNIFDQLKRRFKKKIDLFSGSENGAFFLNQNINVKQHEHHIEGESIF
ncbi:MAG: GHMP kinase [Chitinophagaceae bacterium]|nr:GHMP kinase [Chitinophagaceae bacterium]